MTQPENGPHRPSRAPIEEFDADTLEELKRLAKSRPSSGRQRAAKASAIRTLERLSRGRRHEPPAMPEGWHPGSEAWQLLDEDDSPAVRKRWHANLHDAGRLK